VDGTEVHPSLLDVIAAEDTCAAAATAGAVPAVFAEGAAIGGTEGGADLILERLKKGGDFVAIW
jgi:hypothetical protein